MVHDAFAHGASHLEHNVFLDGFGMKIGHGPLFLQDVVLHDDMFLRVLLDPELVFSVSWLQRLGISLLHRLGDAAFPWSVNHMHILFQLVYCFQFDLLVGAARKSLFVGLGDVLAFGVVPFQIVIVRSSGWFHIVLPLGRLLFPAPLVCLETEAYLLSFAHCCPHRIIYPRRFFVEVI